MNDSAPAAHNPRSPTSRPPRRARRGFRLGVRVLMVGWCLWLLGAWIVLWVVGGWTVPALRSMVFASVVGLMGLWPAVRLSQMTRRYPAVGAGGLPEIGDVTAREWARACGGTLIDWVCLNAVFQIVLWPLQLAAGWEVIQTVWLSIAVVAWSLLTGLLIAWGRGTDRGGWRMAAMLLCIGLVVVEPALWCLGWMSGASPGVGMPMMRLSPIQALWTLSAPGMAPEQAVSIVIAQAPQIVSAAVAALVGWGVLGGLLGRQLNRRG
ncbi:MAG: hypothetical protein AAGL98_05435 [Planctomycetota bacterium]